MSVSCRIYTENDKIHTRVEVVINGRYVGSLRTTIEEAVELEEACQVAAREDALRSADG